MFVEFAALCLGTVEPLTSATVLALLQGVTFTVTGGGSLSLAKNPFMYIFVYYMLIR